MLGAGDRVGGNEMHALGQMRGHVAQDRAFDRAHVGNRRAGLEMRANLLGHRAAHADRDADDDQIGALNGFFIPLDHLVGNAELGDARPRLGRARGGDDFAHGALRTGGTDDPAHPRPVAGRALVVAHVHDEHVSKRAAARPHDLERVRGRLPLEGAALGDEPAANAFRILAVKAARECEKRGSALALHASGADPARLSVMAEGILTGAYRYTRYLTGDRKPKHSLRRALILLDGRADPAARAAVASGQKVAGAINLARDLVNCPPNDLSAVFNWRSLRTESYKLTQYDGPDEAYDLDADPNELDSLLAPPSITPPAEQAAWLEQLACCRGAQCRAREDDGPLPGCELGDEACACADVSVCADASEDGRISVADAQRIPGLEAAAHGFLDCARELRGHALLRAHHEQHSPAPRLALDEPRRAPDGRTVAQRGAAELHHPHGARRYSCARRRAGPPG